MDESILTLPSGATCEIEIEIKRSRFIACAARADNEEAARQVIAQRRALAPDARHHCSAYSFKPEGANPVWRSSDDGEPAGTAGRPMLDALVGSGLENVCVVVTRYFGGILLGAGGLVHAYSQATAEVLAAAPRAQIVRLPQWSFQVEIGAAPKLEATLRAQGYQDIEVSWGQSADFTMALAPAQRPQLEAHLAAALARPCPVVEVGIKSSEILL